MELSSKLEHRVHDDLVAILTANLNKILYYFYLRASSVETDVSNMIPIILVAMLLPIGKYTNFVANQSIADPDVVTTTFGPFFFYINTVNCNTATP